MDIADMESVRDDSYTRTVYQRVVILALLTHGSYALLFAFLNVTVLCFYNMASVVFYLFMLRLIRKGFYRASVSCIHAEVCIFVAVMVCMVGWNAGGALFLIAVSSLVYFCPFRKKYIPYLFSAFEISLFFTLYGFTRRGAAVYLLDDNILSFLYICSACACFGIILFSSFTARVSATSDRRELMKENENLSVRADYDQLTGLLTRYSFQKRLEDCTGGRLALTIGDIDDFKKVNDTYGHVCGDYVLREIAELMRRICGDKADICRWGGEEFLLLFNGVSDKEVLEAVQTLRRTIEKHDFCFEDEALHITMTFGVSFGWEKDDVPHLISIADAQLYHGKKNGKNRVVG